MPRSDMDAVVEALRTGDRFVVTSHDNPDGDALGSLLATHLALVSLGKDSVMVLGGEQPLPGEYAFLRLRERGLLRAAPDVGAHEGNTPAMKFGIAGSPGSAVGASTSVPPQE